MSAWYDNKFNAYNPLDWLAGLGYTLDTPWAMGRNAIAGRNPLQGIFNPEERTSGRDMLESLGVVDPNQEGLDAGDVAGFAVEMADPISWALGAWAPKAIGAVRAANVARKGEETLALARMGMNAGRMAETVGDIGRTARMAEEVIPAAENLSTDLMPFMPRGGALAPMEKAVARGPVPLPPLPDVIPMSGSKYAEQPFYSRLERAANNLPERVKAESLRNMLAKAPEGVSKEEMDWVLKGLPEKGVLSKEQVLQHVKDNGIKVEVKQIEISLLDKEISYWEKLSNDKADALRASGVNVDSFSDADIAQHIPENAKYSEALQKRIALEKIHGPADPLRWQEYSIPGGENYKEMLIKLPEGQDAVSLLAEGKIGVDEARNIRASNYESPHWPEESNVLAHARFDDRIAPNGGKTLFVHEIQSDWHQTGTKQGYKGVFETPQWQKPLPYEGGQLHNYGSGEPRGSVTLRKGEIRGIVTSGANDTNYEDKLFKSLDEAKQWVQSKLPSKVEGTVPDAPFKGDEWAKLTIKHLLDYATKNGYDRLAFANGKLTAQHAAGGATGDAAKGIAKWMDETLPNITKKLLGSKVKMEPMPVLDYIVPSFKIPQAAKSRIARYGQPMISMLPPLATTAGIGYGLTRKQTSQQLSQ